MYVNVIKASVQSYNVSVIIKSSVSLIKHFTQTLQTELDQNHFNLNYHRVIFHYNT